MNIKYIWLCAVVLACFVGCTAPDTMTPDSMTPEMSFLERNPEIKARLLQWEKEASEELKKEINILRAGDAIAKGYSTDRLRKMGPRAKGATLALIETFVDQTGLVWYRGHLQNVIRNTSPANDAFEAVANIGKEAVEPLIAALNDDRPLIRIGAAQTLGLIGDQRAVDPIIILLKDKDISVREAAAGALGKIKDLRAVEPLIVSLKDKDSHVREAAAVALGEIKDLRAVDPLIVSLQQNKHDYNFLSIVEDSLVRIGEPGVEPLIDALKDKNSSVSVCARALGKIKDLRAVEPLIVLLKDKDIFARGAAAEALGEIKDSRAVEPLIVSLKDKGLIVREAAAEALGEIKDFRAVELLIASLKDEDFLVRMAAVKALGGIKDSHAVNPLINALKDKDKSVRMNAAKALTNITGQDFGEDYDQWMRWWQNQKH